MAPLRRLPDWEARLARARASAETRATHLGEHDCCLAACDLVEAMTGIDPAAGLRGYRSPRGALRTIARAGGFETMIEGLARRWGCAEVDPAFAQRGDLVLLQCEPGLALNPADDLGRGLALGLVDLCGRRVLLPAATGWAKPAPRLLAARRAWRIGAG